MKNVSKQVRRLGGICVALIGMSVTSQLAMAQNYDSLADEVERLRRDLQDVQREVYSSYSNRGAADQSPVVPQSSPQPSTLQVPGAGAGPTRMVEDPGTAKLSVRMSEIEDRMAQVTGQLEEMSFQINQLSQQLTAFGGDVDYRLKLLEEKAGITVLESRPNAPLPTGTMQLGATKPTTVFRDPADAPDLETVTTESVSSTTTAFSTTVRTMDDGISMGQIPGDADGQYFAAYEMMLDGQFAEAEKGFTNYLKQFSKEARAADAQYYLGETLYVRGAYREAGQAFTDGLKKYPDSPRGPDSLLKLGMSLVGLNEVKQACATFNEMGRRYPNAMQTVVQRVKVEKSKAGCKR